jgi:flagellar protein FliS
MTNGTMLARYKKTNVETAGRVELVIMCYEKAIQCLEQAKSLYQQKDFENKAKELKKALDIIDELKCSIDFEKGGDIARNLDGIYGYLTQSLLQADIKADLTAFDDAIRIMSDLKDAWKSIVTRSAETAMEGMTDQFASQQVSAGVAA